MRRALQPGLSSSAKASETAANPSGEWLQRSHRGKNMSASVPRVWTVSDLCRHSRIRRRTRTSPLPRMKIAELLWTPSELHADNLCATTVSARRHQNGRCDSPTPTRLALEAPVNAAAGTTKFAVVPDKKRKRRYHMSATQKRLRRDHAAYESRMFNLTLDINNLRQEVMRLMEFRDLRITQLLLTRQRFANSLLKTVEAMIRGVRHNVETPACRFSRAVTTQRETSRAMGACSNVYEFAIWLDRARFSCEISTMQVLFDEVDEDSESERISEIRRSCGPGGSVVEVASNFTFQLRRQVVTALFPHAVEDEVLLAQLIGVRVACPVRLLLYFNAQHELVQQIAQADMLPALLLARPRAMASLLERESRSCGQDV